jgi:ubiquinone/menaquinone biosynthesis C-methylase UbiE
MKTSPDAATYFGGRATSYDALYDAEDADGYALHARMAVTLRLVGDGPGAILDAGMGPGRLCEQLAGRGWTVSGIDASEEMVVAARERLPAASGRLLSGEIEALPFPDGAFDAAVATGVLEYASAPAALRELARVVGDDGLVVVSYPNPHAIYGIWKTRVWYRLVRAERRLLGKPHAWLPRGGSPVAPGRFAELMATAGLSVERLEHTSYLLLPAPLDEAAPRLAAQLGRQLERRGVRLASVLATQVVYAARKTA